MPLEIDRRYLKTSVDLYSKSKEMGRAISTKPQSMDRSLPQTSRSIHTVEAELMEETALV